jgi:hypothetical protein
MIDAHPQTPDLAAFGTALTLCDEQPVRFLGRVAR